MMDVELCLKVRLYTLKSGEARARKLKFKLVSLVMSQHP
jgi:hypothetical protein